MRMRVMAVAAIAMSFVGRGADAAVINLINIGGVTPGSQSAIAFQTAASFWASHLTNDVTLNINVGYSALGTGVVAQAGSTRSTRSVTDVSSRIRARGSGALDATVSNTLARTTTGGQVSVITAAYADPVARTGFNVAGRMFDNDGGTNNRSLSVTSANAKALGFSTSTTSVDATIRFSTRQTFDFDPTNGITAGTLDFVAVAIHEIGHALGLVSGVDLYDNYMGRGPSASIYAYAPVGNQAWGTVFDLFRYSANPTGLGGGGAQMTWAPGEASYFSINGGAMFQDGQLSSGAFNGDRWQASHWKRATTRRGIMDPTVAPSLQGVVTGLDFAALDAIGWNLSFDVLSNPTWSMSTRSLGLYGSTLGEGVDEDFEWADVSLFDATAVPEPATWATMIVGFGLIGATARRRGARAA